MGEKQRHPKTCPAKTALSLAQEWTRARQAVVSNLELCLAESLEALGRGAEADLIAGLAKRLEAMAFELCIPGVDDAGYEELNESGLWFVLGR